MAPEVMKGEEFTEFADVYSFGVILWEILSEHIPFAGYSLMQIIGTVGYDDGFTMQLPQGGNPLISQIMRDCLKRSPSTRPLFTDIVKTI